MRLVEEAEDLAGNVLATSLLVVHDTGRGGQDDVTERTRGQELLNPVLNLTELDVEARRDDTTLVDAAVELDDNLTGAVVVDLLELANVAVLLHNREELDDDLGRGSDKHLALTLALGVDNAVKSVVKNGNANHDGRLCDLEEVMTRGPVDKRDRKSVV